jgi:putative addiction module component (TIGR02574 family)
MSQIEVPPEILSLSVNDRLLLVGKIWDSISKDGLHPLPQATQDLIDCRIEEADEKPQTQVDASKVFEELGRDRFPRGES